MPTHSARLLMFVVSLTAMVHASPVAGTQAVRNEANSDRTATSRASADQRHPLFDIDALARGPIDGRLLRREIAAEDLRVRQVADHGFWVSSERGTTTVFVVPAEGSLITVRPGEVVNLHGEVRLAATGRSNTTRHDSAGGSMTRYVYAYTVRPAG